jgi:hypothetical protein
MSDMGGHDDFLTRPYPVFGAIDGASFLNSRNGVSDGPASCRGVSNGSVCRPAEERSFAVIWGTIALYLAGGTVAAMLLGIHERIGAPLVERRWMLAWIACWPAMALVIWGGLLNGLRIALFSREERER